MLPSATKYIILFFFSFVAIKHYLILLLSISSMSRQFMSSHGVLVSVDDSLGTSIKARCIYSGRTWKFVDDEAVFVMCVYGVFTAGPNNTILCVQTLNCDLLTKFWCISETSKWKLQVPSICCEVRVVQDRIFMFGNDGVFVIIDRNTLLLICKAQLHHESQPIINRDVVIGRSPGLTMTDKRFVKMFSVSNTAQVFDVEQSGRLVYQMHTPMNDVVVDVMFSCEHVFGQHHFVAMHSSHIKLYDVRASRNGFVLFKRPMRGKMLFVDENGLIVSNDCERRLVKYSVKTGQMYHSRDYDDCLLRCYPLFHDQAGDSQQQQRVTKLIAVFMNTKHLVNFFSVDTLSYSWV